MKRYLSIIIILFMLFSFFGCAKLPQQSATPTPAQLASATPVMKYGDVELDRAISFGIGEYAEEHSVTYQEFFSMLDQLIYLVNPAKLDDWKEQQAKAHQSEQKMTRQEGMLAIFRAAKALGSEYDAQNVDWTQLNNKIGTSCWDDMTWSYPLFDGWDAPSKVGVDTWDNEMFSAYFYNLGRISVVNNQLLLGYDSEKNSMRSADPLLYTEALRAAVRLYDSNLSATDRVPTAEDEALLKAADERREQIRNSPTTITVTGTSYYVSNHGNDENDGKSPETAWATLEKVNQTNFQKGDGVFFERGSFFRGQLWPKNDITYSAYGTGAKPIITMSTEDGADPAKWSLLEGTDNIWVFYKDMYDTGCIVFNNGDSWATRHTAFWNGESYVEATDRSSPIDMKSLENLTFYSLPDYSGISWNKASLEDGRLGKLVLRCDAGNPGSVYQDIEFFTSTLSNIRWIYVLQTGRNVTVDNLCFLYAPSGLSIQSSCVVQNCEVGWIGGAIMSFDGSGLGTAQAAVIRCGDGILFAGGDHAVVRNNYVHHTYDCGITTETGTWQENKDRYAYDYTVEGNLVERCGGGSLIGDFEAFINGYDANLIFKDVSISDNYYMYSGYGWSHLTPDCDWGEPSSAKDSSATILLAFRPGMAQNIQISNNVFYLSRYYLINEKESLSASDAATPPVTFSGNTYVQNNFATYIFARSDTSLDEILYGLDAATQANRLLGDSSATVFTPLLPD